MAIRRTREEKIQIQRRREAEKYTWQSQITPASSSASTDSNPGRPAKKRADSRKSVPGMVPVQEKHASVSSQEQVWLRRDLLQTAGAFFVVLLMLAVFVWRG